MAKTVTSLFSSENQAASVVRRLEDAGVASGSICLFTESGRSNRFWDAASGFGDETGGSTSGDAHAFSEGVRRGHALVAVRCDDDEVDRVIDILDGDDTLDLEEHESTWRSEGWSGCTGSVGSGMATGLSDVGGLSDSSGMNTSGTGAATGMTGAGLTGSSVMSRTLGERDEVIPVAEEELNVSKRETNRGRVRIHSHVIERPVQEQITLREENVQVERRPVGGSTRTGNVSGNALFQSRTIEMNEKREEAVVSKEARVKEELVVRKDMDERTETISDTVRSTQVYVEDERGNTISGAGTTASDR